MAKVLTTKDIAEEMGVTSTKKLRRYLRKIEVFQDGKYTRYGWVEGSKEHKDIVKQLRGMMNVEKQA